MVDDDDDDVVVVVSSVTSFSVLINFWNMPAICSRLAVWSSGVRRSDSNMLDRFIFFGVFVFVFVLVLFVVVVCVVVVYVVDLMVGGYLFF